jgi:hypothetical protein
MNNPMLNLASPPLKHDERPGLYTPYDKESAKNINQPNL